MRCGATLLADTIGQLTPKSGRRRPSDIKIITAENAQFCISPRSASYNSALASAANNLQAVFGDLLRSPAAFAVETPKRTSIHKSLPGRPHSISLPPTLVELPGSILLENQGFPASTAVEEPLVRPVSQNIRRSTHPSSNGPDDGEGFLELLSKFPEPLGHTQSVPDLKESCHEMRTVRSGNALKSIATYRPCPSDAEHEKALRETGSRRRSRKSLNTSAPGAPADASKSTPNARNGEHTSTRTQSGAYRLLQPSSQIREGQLWEGSVQQSGNRSSDVSRFVSIKRCGYSSVGACITKQFHNHHLLSLPLSSDALCLR